MISSFFYITLLFTAAEAKTITHGSNILAIDRDVNAMSLKAKDQDDGADVVSNLKEQSEAASQAAIAHLVRNAQDNNAAGSNPFFINSYTPPEHGDKDHQNLMDDARRMESKARVAVKTSKSSLAGTIARSLPSGAPAMAYGAFRAPF